MGPVAEVRRTLTDSNVRHSGIGIREHFMFFLETSATPLPIPVVRAASTTA